MTGGIVMGNEAIGQAIVSNGCAVATAYPGTPATEIQEAVMAFARETGAPIHAEWSVNEKVAYEVALAASYTGKRAAVSMKQVGLNAAADPFMRSAYLGVKGGFLVVSADDPGPHSSQTEQDSRFFAMFASVPVLDPASPRQAAAFVPLAFTLSEDYQIPVVLRPTTRVCHARQPVTLEPPDGSGPAARFHKEPGRWAATPGEVLALHRGLNEKLARIAADERLAPVHVPGDGTFRRTCLVGSGVAFAHAQDVLDEMGLEGRLDLYQVTAPFPLCPGFIQRLRTGYDRVLVLEETDQVVELQLRDSTVEGRKSRIVPGEGELRPEVIRGILASFLGLPPAASAVEAPKAGARPTLCAGCAHRAAFVAIRDTFPNGIFPSDIGCYTLGVNLGAVDTCHCMGAGISQAAGFYHAYAQDGAGFPAIVATIGDSTFYHSGIPALVNAVSQRARFILVILDNGTTAMTGHQPTPGQAGAGPAIPLRNLVLAAGVTFLREVDPYNVAGFTASLKEADCRCRAAEGGVAVIIASHPCVLRLPGASSGEGPKVHVTEECTGCQICLDRVECPAIRWSEDSGKAFIEESDCNGCGVCLGLCPVEAIVAAGEERV
jgi:indolepyruvate ferredoxin oxidoreductase alpha subunit